MLLLSPDTDTIITLTQLEGEGGGGGVGWGGFQVICDLHLFLWLHMFLSSSNTIKSFEPCMEALWCGKQEEKCFRSFGMYWATGHFSGHTRKKESGFRSFVMYVVYFFGNHAQFSPRAVLSSMTHAVALSYACKFCAGRLLGFQDYCDFYHLVLFSEGSDRVKLWFFCHPWCHMLS